MSTKTIDKQDSNYELITRTDVEDSPFVIIGKDNEYFGVMGKYRITEPEETKEEVLKKLQKITWNRIIQVIMILNNKEV